MAESYEMLLTIWVVLCVAIQLYQHISYYVFYLLLGYSGFSLVYTVY